MVIRYVAVGAVIIILVATGCSSVGRMERQYREGDVRQLDRLIETLSNEQYPYATRKKAAQALGAIGNPKAVPALVEALFDPDPRDGIEIEAVAALAMIRDERAIQPLSRLMMSSQSSDLRKAIITAIGAIGGTEAAEALVEVLTFYAILEAQQRIYDRQRLLEGMALPPQKGYGGQDTTGTPVTPSLHGRQTSASSGPIGMFGDPLPMTTGEDEDKDLAAEQQILTKAFMTIGQPAVPVLISKLGQTVKPGEIDIRDMIQGILSQLTLTPALADTAR